MEIIKNLLVKIGSPVSKIISDTDHHIIGGIIVALLLGAALWIVI